MSDTATALLEFAPDAGSPLSTKALRKGLSAVVQVGNTLWLANDETAALERLEGEDDRTRFRRHSSFPLADLLALPASGEARSEADLEGLDCRDSYLWLVGSHSLRRPSPEKDKSVSENLDRLARIRRDGNCYLLARIPLIEREGVPAPVRQGHCGSTTLHAARLAGDAQGNELTRLLEDDPHLAPFLAIPGKDNGFDIEGLAAGDGGRLFIGLRGPVLRGWAVILELRPEWSPDTGHLHLAPLEPSTPDSPRYRKHLLDLDGLGIRDLCIHGRDLLILAGPSMTLDGPIAVYRWRKGARPEAASLVTGKGLKRILELPPGKEHAEGMTLFAAPGQDPDALLLVYDTPDKARLEGDHAVHADRFPLPAE
jgi:hypothetical protein